MDKGLKDRSPRQALLANQWDSGGSEILAQQQMQIDYHGQNGHKLPQKENADYFKQVDDEDKVANDDETYDKVYDSLDVESPSHATRNLSQNPHTEYIHTKINQRERTSQLVSNDDYSDLRYDPNWRSNLKRNGRFINSPPISIEEYYTEEKPRQPYANRQVLEIKGGYRYIADTTPVVVVTPYMADSESDQPYCLHPQDDQTSSVTSRDRHRRALQLGSQEADLSRPPSSSTINESNNTLNSDFRETRENSFDNAGHNIRTSTELTEHIHGAEFQPFYQPEWRQHIQSRPIQTQKMSTPTPSPNKKPERLMEDVVERNKITLGWNTSKSGSYVRAHAVKQKVPGHGNKVHKSVKETSSAENQEDSSDPRLGLLQKTEQLQVTQIRKGKKAQRKEYPNPSQQQQPSDPEVRIVQGDNLSFPLVRPTTVTQPKAQKMTSSQPVPSGIHLNINRNTSSHLLSILQDTGQDALINLACHCSHTQLSHASEVQTALSPRTTALKLPLLSGEEDQNCPDAVHTKQFPQNLSRTPIIASSQSLASYTVLPPIEKLTTGKEHGLSPAHCVNTASPIPRSSSDGYLSQMEKQKRLKARVTYKEYNLKDYKQLKPVTNLQGLGPDYTAIAKIKMKRQKLYSNVICEQNKKISRIPFLLAKDPDRKVPRMKALEYAKTIAKPPLQSQPKQRKKNQSELMPYLEDLDISKMATLELLRQRHEEEKQAVAYFRKVHAV
ncbi:hypothetical protein Q5P01_019952 [Channa striata]|uniref:Jhy protein homolog n=1 Tax=Channa striata TaxID=64152 RepID=A0AA88M535_CHASR|nr:hypothetical protein Q5P01_019952 [Channa striata]